MPNKVWINKATNKRWSVIFEDSVRPGFQKSLFNTYPNKSDAAKIGKLLFDSVQILYDRCPLNK